MRESAYANLDLPRSGTAGSGAGPRKNKPLLEKVRTLIKTFREAEPRGLGLAPEKKTSIRENVFIQDIPIIYLGAVFSMFEV
jgi:hypothetical protein